MQRPTLRYTEGTVVVPGDRLGTIRQVRAGHGCHVKNGHIYATLAGRLSIEDANDVTLDDTNNDTGLGSLSDSNRISKQPGFVCNVSSVHPSSAPPQPQLEAANYVLRPNQLVLGEIVRVTPQNAVVDIRVAENVGPLHNCCVEGAIRTEDVRSMATETIALADCFQPGDLVAARVISLGDSRRYFLSTAETSLGVIRAIASNNNRMSSVLGSGSLKRRKKEDRVLVPISWKEMEDPVTGLKEPRKVAKPLILRSETDTPMITDEK